MTHNIPSEEQTIREKIAAADKELIDEEERLELVEKAIAQTDGKIRIVDDQSHLLCVYNPSTRSIEIQVPVGRSSDKGKKFSIGIDDVIRAGAGNPFTDQPRVEFKAIKISNGRG